MKIEAKKTKRFTMATLCLVVVGLFVAFSCDKPPVDDGDENDTIVKTPSVDSSVWISENEHVVYGNVTIELTFYPSENKVHVKSTPEYSSSGYSGYYSFEGNYIEGYRVIDNKLYFMSNGKFYDSPYWIITFLSENEMNLEFCGRIPLDGRPRCDYYEFICQTVFKGI